MNLVSEINAKGDPSVFLIQIVNYQVTIAAFDVDNAQRIVL
jgi:hypothetical protein